MLEVEQQHERRMLQRLGSMNFNRAKSCTGSSCPASRPQSTVRGAQRSFSDPDGNHRSWLFTNSDFLEQMVKERERQRAEPRGRLYQWWKSLEGDFITYSNCPEQQDRDGQKNVNSPLVEPAWAIQARRFCKTRGAETIRALQSVSQGGLPTVQWAYKRSNYNVGYAEQLAASAKTSSRGLAKKLHDMPKNRKPPTENSNPNMSSTTQGKTPSRKQISTPDSNKMSARAAARALSAGRRGAADAVRKFMDDPASARPLSAAGGEENDDNKAEEMDQASFQPGEFHARRRLFQNETRADTSLVNVPSSLPPSSQTESSSVHSPKASPEAKSAPKNLKPLAHSRARGPSGTPISFRTAAIAIKAKIRFAGCSFCSSEVGASLQPFS